METTQDGRDCCQGIQKKKYKYKKINIIQKLKIQSSKHISVAIVCTFRLILVKTKRTNYMELELPLQQK